MTTLRANAFLVLACAITLLACDSGLDSEEARSTCDDLRTSLEACMNDAAYDSCVACHEDCGVDCVQSGCPAQFSCD